MPATDIRSTVGQVACKAETTIGTGATAGSPAAADYVTASAVFSFQYEQFPNPAQTNSYDSLPPIPGAQRATVSMTIPMVGSGAAGTAPDWWKLLPGAAMISTTTASAVGAPTAATAGTATTVTAQTPFGTTAGQYRGMPILLAGNPAAGATDVVIDYTAGRLITLANTYSPVLSTSTTLQIPVNFLSSPTSDDALESSFTIYGWTDDIRHVVTGAKITSMAINMTAGQYATLSLTFSGMVASKFQNVARPAGYVPNTRTPPLWRAGLSRLNRVLARCASVSVDFGLRGTYPENPEAAQGYDPANLVGRAIRIQLDPFMHTTDTPNRATLMDANTQVPWAAIWGSTAGNRFAISCPSAVLVAHQGSSRNEMGVDSIVLAPTTPDGGILLSAF